MTIEELRSVQTFLEKAEEHECSSPANEGCSYCAYVLLPDALDYLKLCTAELDDHGELNA